MLEALTKMNAMLWTQQVRCRFPETYRKSVEVINENPSGDITELNHTTRQLARAAMMLIHKANKPEPEEAKVVEHQGE